MKKILIQILRTIGIKANEDNLKLSNIKRFLQAKWRKSKGGMCLVDQILPYDEETVAGIELHKQEQIKWRYRMLHTHPQGRKCLTKGECPCECNTLEGLLADDTCDQKCYPPMMKESDWRQFKKDNDIC